MAPVIHLDTHVLVWLYGGQHRRIPEGVRRLINTESVGASPLVELELQYLYEVGRVGVPAATVVAELVPRLEMTWTAAPLAAVVRRASELSWTRDPFDRLIAATALADGATLVTADRTLLEHVPSAEWPLT